MPFCSKKIALDQTRPNTTAIGKQGLFDMYAHIFEVGAAQRLRGKFAVKVGHFRSPVHILMIRQGTGHADRLRPVLLLLIDL